MLHFCLIYETKWTFTFPISFGNLCRNLALESYLTSGVRRRMGISSHFHSQALDYETQPSFIFVSLMKQNENFSEGWNDEKNLQLDEKVNLPKATFVPKTWLLHNIPLCFFWPFQSLIWCKNPAFWWKMKLPKATFVRKTWLLQDTPLCFLWLFQSLKWW